MTPCSKVEQSNSHASHAWQYGFCLRGFARNTLALFQKAVPQSFPPYLYQTPVSAEGAGPADHLIPSLLHEVLRHER